jgi:hypothetical protein
LAIGLENIHIIILEGYSAVVSGVKHQKGTFALASKLTMTKQTNVRLKKEYLISRLEMFDLDTLIMPSFCAFLVEFRAVVLPPFIQFSELDLSFDSG